MSHWVKNAGFNIVNDVRNILSRNNANNRPGNTVRLVENSFKSFNRLNKILLFIIMSMSMLLMSQIYVTGFDKNKIDVFVRKSVTYKCYSSMTYSL